MAPPTINRGERLAMVKKLGQPPGLPAVPDGLPADTRSGGVGMDLDGPRASALSVLVFGGPVPIGRLAEIEQVSAPAITKTVTALEDAGLVRRVRHPTDRRVVLVEAT